MLDTVVLYDVLFNDSSREQQQTSHHALIIPSNEKVRLKNTVCIQFAFAEKSLKVCSVLKFGQNLELLFQFKI